MLVTKGYDRVYANFRHPNLLTANFEAVAANLMLILMFTELSGTIKCITLASKHKILRKTVLKHNELAYISLE